MLEDIPQDSEEPVEDEDSGSTPFVYTILSYGADYPVDGLVKRMNSNNIFVPPFQRGYVWSAKQASRFVESMLLGLPVPGIFLAKEPDNRLLIIDGQQRLKTLQFFFDGKFVDGTVFALQDVVGQFLGKRYESLEPGDRVRLDDAILHATIVRQEEPSEDISSIYQIFERLNTGGTQLQPQEIRACIYHGPFNSLLSTLNAHASWRSLFGNVSARQKDQELILRFLALHFDPESYDRPMKKFLNQFMSSNRYLKKHSEAEFQKAFYPTIDAILESVGPKAFKPVRAVNAAVFDAVTVGFAHRLKLGEVKNRSNFRNAYVELLNNDEFKKAYLSNTSDKEQVETRLRIAKTIFGAVL